MTNLWPVLLFGFLLGIEHALEADHIAAVASLATRSTSFRSTMKTATLWGIGHAATLFAFGAIFVALGTALPEGLSRVFEFGVGLMLVYLGFDVLRRLRMKKIHLHAHEHEANGVRHLHAHSHAGEVGHVDHRHEHSLPAVLVGSIHGLAGSAALILLSLQMVPSGAVALLYLAIFGLGTVLGMVLFATLVFLPLRMSAGRLAWTSQALESLLGATTMALGAWIAVRVTLS